MAMIARCRCGAVEIEAAGAPIVTAVCYCADCQAGSRQIEELPGAGPVRDADGGTAYVLFRKDRVQCTRGAALLKGYKIKAGSVTNRVAASCCNSAMMVNFDKGPFWVPMYRARLVGEPPPLEMRICTRSRRAGSAMQGNVPSYAGYPARLMVRFVAAGLGMMLGR